SGQTNLPWRRKSPSTWTCRRRNARKSSCSWTSASVSTGPAAGAPPMRTFSATIPRANRRRILENSSLTPRSRSVATKRVLMNSGRPTWLNQMIEHRAASTTSHKLIRHQRKPTRHLCQKPGRISRAVGRNGEISQNELVKSRRENKCPTFAIQRNNSQRGVKVGQFRAKIHGKLFAIFQF